MNLVRKVPFVAIRKAIFKLLKEGQDTQVFGRVPIKNAELPYIVLSSTNCIPTSVKDVVIWDVKMEIDAYTDNNNSIKLNEILNDIVTLISGYADDLEVEDYSIIETNVENVETYEAESNCWYGQVTVRFQLQYKTDISDETTIP